MSVNKLPVLAVTMGDPAGCGPEIIAKVLTDPKTYTQTQPIVIGNARILAWAVDVIGAKADVLQISSPEQAVFAPNHLNVIDPATVDLSELQMGKIQQAAGSAAYEYLIHAIDLAMEKKVDGIVTAPLSKEAMNLAGYHFDGHTEILATRTNSKKVTMMLASGHFRVTHVSTHVSLRTAIERCKAPRILDVIHTTSAALNKLGIQNPRIAVAGLNPHCGEGGLFGNEDMDHIQPAIDKAIEEGFNMVPYPVPPDTVFVRMAEFKEFDAVIAQYHDQGHIAAKIVDFWGGVNITLGLPIIRASVDHGTAFDIVGTGKSNPASLYNAMEYARLMASNM